MCGQMGIVNIINNIIAVIFYLTNIEHDVVTSQISSKYASGKFRLGVLRMVSVNTGPHQGNYCLLPRLSLPQHSGSPHHCSFYFVIKLRLSLESQLPVGRASGHCHFCWLCTTNKLEEPVRFTIIQESRFIISFLPADLRKLRHKSIEGFCLLLC